jgi:peptidoglycan hydrolase-like protein with peptidoglycan-binding domain
VDDTGSFGGGTEAAVMDVQRKMGYKPTGEIGEGFVKMVMK